MAPPLCLFCVRRHFGTFGVFVQALDGCSRLLCSSAWRFAAWTLDVGGERVLLRTSTPFCTHLRTHPLLHALHAHPRFCISAWRIATARHIKHISVAWCVSLSEKAAIASGSVAKRDIDFSVAADALQRKHLGGGKTAINGIGNACERARCIALFLFSAAPRLRCRAVRYAHTPHGVCTWFHATASFLHITHRAANRDISALSRTHLCTHRTRCCITLLRAKRTKTAMAGCANIARGGRRAGVTVAA